MRNQMVRTTRRIEDRVCLSTVLVLSIVLKISKREIK